MKLPPTYCPRCGFSWCDGTPAKCPEWGDGYARFMRWLGAL